MPKKKVSTLNLNPDEHYWENFLRSQGLVSEVPLPESAPKQTSRAAAEGELSQDMFTFAYRVAESLTPVDGMSEDARDRALKVREQIRQDLRDVFLGKEGFDKWFTRTKTQFGLHSINFTRILYNALKGLRSEEARDLRAAYGQTLQKMGSMGG